MEQTNYCADLLGEQKDPPPKTKDSQASRKSRKLFQLGPKKGDPVRKHRREEKRELLIQKRLQKQLEESAKRKAEEEAAKCSSVVTPSFGKRFEVHLKGETPVEERPRTYIAPEPRSLVKEKAENRAKYIEMLNFCQFDESQALQPLEEIKLNKVMKVDSPTIKMAKVVTPQRPSFFPSDIYPTPPKREDLKLKEPTSKIIINEKEQQAELMSSFELILEGKSRAQYEKEIAGKENKPCKKKPKQKKKKKKKKKRQISMTATEEGETGDRKKKKKRRDQSGEKKLGEGDEEKELATYDFGGDNVDKNAIEAYLKEEEELLKQYGEGEGEGVEVIEPTEETYLTRMFRKQVSQVSKSTSLNEKELMGFEVSPDFELEECPFIDRVLQKFRRDSELERYKKPKREVKRGTLESHSFTRIEQNTLKQFYYGVVYGNIHQGDDHFSEVSRNNQGICMAVAAYCFATELHPSRWTEQTIGIVLEIGNKLYLDSVENLHLHDTTRELKPPDLHKFLYIGDDKFRFVVEEPYVSGLTRSVEKNVYNVTKGLQVFFAENHAGVFQSLGLDVMIWKDKYYYMFDARPRTKDLFPDKNGNATLTIVYDIASLVSIFLDRSELGNWPFLMSKVSIMKKLKLYEEEDEEDIKEGSQYNILSPNKAVVQGSFDLADKCFGFSRNKQSLTMAVIALVYSRITPPNSWHRRTIDKIMIIGNQLYLECAEQELIMEMTIDNLPALFTIGPYLVEIFLYANRFVDVMYKKGKCVLQEALECFFSKNTNAVLQIGKFNLAVWQQRNMYYCFDPYSRNNQGMNCRNGMGCVSMNADIETLVQTISSNFPDNAYIFYIHALKVLKIHRDPAMARIFSKTTKMDDISPETLKKYKMKKSKKKATEKPITIDLTQTSIKRLLPGESPEPSLQEVSSDVDSLIKEQLPCLFEPCHVLKKLPPTKMKEYADVVDLDSPSLSDTQIEPQRPVPDKCLEEVTLLDLDSFVLTQEEIEMIEVPEGEGEGGEGGGGRGGKGEGEGGEGGEDMDELDNTYLAMNEFAQVHPESLDSYHSRISQMVNTEVTAAFLPVSHKVLKPTNVLAKKAMKRCMELQKAGAGLASDIPQPEPEVTMEEELLKENNFVELPDDTQLIRGTQNIADLGKEVDNTAPYVCIIAATVAKKYSIATWSSDLVDYVLTGGLALYELANVQFEKAPKFEIPKISLGKDNYRVFVDYLFDGQFSDIGVEKALTHLLFPKHDIGLIVTTYYSCAVFFKNHLYYLFDSYGNNEVGLSEGPNNKGMAIFARFKTLEHLVRRIVYNKNKRETSESFRFSNFLMFSVKVETIRPEALHANATEVLDTDMGGEEGVGDEENIIVKSQAKDSEVIPEPRNVVGFRLHDGVYTIQGTKALKGRNAVGEQLKEDHFVCICTGLMLSCCAIDKWDTRKIDYVIDHGGAVFAHADNLEVVEKRIIKNILIDNYFFDIIVRRKEIPYEHSQTFTKSAKYILHKNNQVLIQFPNCSYVLYKNQDFWYLFDPYSCLANGNKDDSETGPATWSKFWDLKQVTTRIKGNMVKGSENYSFFRYQITSIKKAPRKTVLEQKMMLYELNKEIEQERIVKPLHEEPDWLLVDPIPWSQRKKKSACGYFRCKREIMWNNWDTEYPNDLYTILSTINQFSNKFMDKSRGKQTICNCVCAIGMTVIYNLSEWNSPIMDSILINGDNYFYTCVKGIDTENYEVLMDDLSPDCTIFPYTFKVDYYPVVDGTMFLMDKKKYNLYKALRYFFDGYDKRCGIICAVRGDIRRYVAFGKIQNKEYFMFDSQSFGPPMFLERQSKAYMLRCTNFARLLHVLVVALRGGDFFLYNVECKNFQPIE